MKFACECIFQEFYRKRVKYRGLNDKRIFSKTSVREIVEEFNEVLPVARRVRRNYLRRESTS